MPQARFRSVDGLDMCIEYDTFGDPSHPALLLIMGYTAQMVQWDERFCAMLADRGLFVVRFDNRDCGLSTKLDGATVDVDEVIRAALMEEPVPSVPYTLREMAADAVALLDHLGVAPEAAAALLTPPPPDREGYIAHSTTWQIWQSRRYRSDELSRRNAARDWDRSFYPEGGPRQLAAIYASGNRDEGLSALSVPTLVIHGLDDTLITPSGGERTAELVPGATLMLVDDMGHDFPEPLWPVLVDAIASHVQRAA